MPINRRNKGQRGELLWRDVLRSKGFTARRGQQFCGANGDSDVICEELANIHFEVKFVQIFNARKALEQAKSDAKDGQLPVVVQKSKKKDWIAVMDAGAYLDMVVENQALKKLERDRWEGTVKAFGVKIPSEKIIEESVETTAREFGVSKNRIYGFGNQPGVTSIEVGVYGDPLGAHKTAKDIPAHKHEKKEFKLGEGL